jgi:2,3,4,5-tetrahydropyridine-2-carboxylate N-succinyltransferase
MSLAALESTVNSAFDARDGISTATKGEVRDAVDHALDLLDKGEARVAEREASGKWKVHQWLKKAVLLSFRLNDMGQIAGGPGKAAWWDKVPSKFDGWGENRFRDAGFRAVPGSIVRRSAFIARNVVLMPSFVNLGAYVDEATMIDTWSTVGSCAQIGKRVHISGGVGIGGVLEPLQAEPVIVEDDCFIGARSEVAEGVIVRGVVDGRVPGRLHQNRRPRDRRDFCRRGAGIFRRGSRHAAAETAEERPARSRDRLCRDRQARRRAHPRQDQHQRIAARLISQASRGGGFTSPDLNAIDIVGVPRRQIAVARCHRRAFLHTKFVTPKTG